MLLVGLIRPEEDPFFHFIKLFKDIEYVFVEKLSWGSVAELFACFLQVNKSPL